MSARRKQTQTRSAAEIERLASNGMSEKLNKHLKNPNVRSFALLPTDEFVKKLAKMK
jgi:hypothetical protein